MSTNLCAILVNQAYFTQLSEKLDTILTRSSLLNSKLAILSIFIKF